MIKLPFDPLETEADWDSNEDIAEKVARRTWRIAGETVHDTLFTMMRAGKIPRYVYDLLTRRLERRFKEEGT